MKYAAPLIAAAGLLIGGAYTYAAEETVTGIALLAAGLVTIGAWIAVEIRTDRKDRNDG